MVLRVYTITIGVALIVDLIEWLITKQPLLIFTTLLTGVLTGVIIHFLIIRDKKRLGIPQKVADPVQWLHEQRNQLVTTMNHSQETIIRTKKEIEKSEAELFTLFDKITSHHEGVMDQIGESNSGMEELTESVKNIAGNTTEVAELSRTTKESAERTVDTVLVTVQKINKVAHAAGESTKSMESLTESSEKIGQMIRVINDIADQTNLLALNAAIEASRAGEHGRGFAVVADEVKKLAEKTTVATKEIREVIKTIQKQTTEAIEKIQSGGDDIDQSIETVTEAGENMVNMVNMVELVASKITSISVAAEEQSACSQQITETFKNITRKVQKSSVDVENTSQLVTDVLEGLQEAL